MSFDLDMGTYAGVMQHSRPATPADYAPLKRELEGTPYSYKLRVIAQRDTWHHRLTPEERARGHKLTAEDRRKGGRNVPREVRKRAVAGPKLLAAGVPYRFTAESSRRANQRKREIAEGRRMAAMLLVDRSPACVLPEAIFTPGSLEEIKRRFPPMTPELFHAEMSKPAEPQVPPCAAAMGCLCAGHARGDSAAVPCDTSEVPAPDPFTLSALKRFRLGPASVFILTRSQRAHVAILCDQGYLEGRGGPVYSLTAKGRAALEGA